MTPGRAALVGLMHRYLGGLMDPFVTLFEVHKLLYFIQEAGEPLRLRYVQGPYGPYAENLGRVLTRIEGHLVTGYADGGDDPEQQLELVPGAVEEAKHYLDDHPDTRARFEQVADLLAGFETPFGLELVVDRALGRSASGRRDTSGGRGGNLCLERPQAPVFAASDSLGGGRVAGQGVVRGGMITTAVPIWVTAAKFFGA
jgi:hypothetical protein